jgi:alpha-ketoglutaric semialdehyde dehydrogenase
MFILDGALSTRGDAIAAGWAGSLTMGAGQFCTNPGVAVVTEGAVADAFTAAAGAALAGTGAQTMLTAGIAFAYHAGRDRVSGTNGVREVMTSTCDLRNATPYLFATTAADWLANEALGEEVFGPLGMVVTARDADEVRRAEPRDPSTRLQISRPLE